MTIEERINTVIAALRRNPRTNRTGVNWDRWVRRMLAKAPADRQIATLEYTEQWCRRQAEIYLEQANPPSTRLQ
jgi:hypothetical protein